MQENKIEIKKIDVAKYASRLDPVDAPEEFLECVEENDEAVFALFVGAEVVGLALIDDDSEAFIFVYIFSEFRNKGYGYAAACNAERSLKATPVKKIRSMYDTKDQIAKYFAAKCGFKDKFASCYMRYEGEPFDEEDLPVREYRDEDFEQAFFLSAEAFHRMRVSTGCFPESVVATPREDSRKRWLESEEDQYVYVLDGEVVGYADIDGNELDTVSIKISHQGKGLGRKFVKYLTNRIIEKDEGAPVLWCVVGNTKARALYDSLGYKEVKTIAFPEKYFN